MRGAWARVPEWAKAAGIVLSLAGAVAGIAWKAARAYGEQESLPARVSSVEDSVRLHGAALRRLQQTTDAIEALTTTVRVHGEQIDTVRTQYGELMRRLDRVLCYSQAQAGERPAGECVR